MMSSHRPLSPTISPPATKQQPAKQQAAKPIRLSHYGRKQRVNRLVPWLLLLAGAAAVAMLSANRYLLSVHVLDSPILAHSDEQPLNVRVHVADERLLRLVIEQCAKAEDSVIWIDQEGNLVVQEEINPKQCPPVDVMLRGAERGISICTDVALYVMHAGARVIPMVSKERYDSYCGASTARLFLENMYSSFISARPDVLHMMLVDHAYMWEQDAKLHKHMNVFLCKTLFCQELMHRHIVRMGYRAHVWLMGHTSSDPSVDAPRGTSTQELSFLHVAGTSNLKHTSQLLQCWQSRPDFPILNIVGSFTWGKVQGVANSLNIQFHPQVAHGSTADKQPQRIGFPELHQLQVQNPIHICTSERDSFGHYINEARAVGAVIISTDHPPMSELVNPGTGLLISPERVFSYHEMALGRYSPINAVLNHWQICEAVDAALTIPTEEMYTRGQLAREQYLYENAVFIARMQDLKSFLKQRADGLQLMDHRAGLWQHGGVLQQREDSGRARQFLEQLPDA